mmetsp:Transcript_14780/g.25917  ORF Transcript_14780/g.25917 Transcript_14780/m.25917 type:complete len:216 (-) Transcript_14780:472-1119(-)
MQHVFYGSVQISTCRSCSLKAGLLIEAHAPEGCCQLLLACPFLSILQFPRKCPFDWAWGKVRRCLTKWHCCHSRFCLAIPSIAVARCWRCAWQPRWLRPGTTGGAPHPSKAHGHHWLLLVIPRSAGRGLNRTPSAGQGLLPSFSPDFRGEDIVEILPIFAVSLGMRKRRLKRHFVWHFRTLRSEIAHPSSIALLFDLDPLVQLCQRRSRSLRKFL